MNLLDVKDTKVTNITLNPQEWIKQLKGSLNTMMPDASLISDRYRKELVDPVINSLYEICFCRLLICIYLCRYLREIHEK